MTEECKRVVRNDPHHQLMLAGIEVAAAYMTAAEAVQKNMRRMFFPWLD